ncbi:MAG: hypothetical protein KQH53_17165 [Desulfarculaceae bacterium]|nr:hypothetical protein [Desulfarculaceae bacterium]
MLRIITSMLGVLGLSVIITESLNHFHLFGFPLKIPYLAVPGLLIYLWYEFSENILPGWMERRPGSVPKLARMIQANRIVIFLLFIGLAVLLPLLWWGVIRKMAAMANQGKVVY